MSSPKTAAPTDSAPNKDTAGRQKAWREEIHTPVAEYNANVPCDAIEPDPNNRDKIDKDDVANLAASIKVVGLLQPIVLRALDGGKYRIIAGEHRWRAHLELKLKTIAARIYKNETDLAAAKKKAVENAQRVDLTPIERAKRFKELSDLGENQKGIGVLFGGLSQPVVANALRMLELPADVQQMISDEKLSEAHGVSLVRFARWPRICSTIARMALDHEYSSKSLNSEGLPFSGQLESNGLLEKIQIKERYYSDGAIYQLPRHFLSHADFIVGEHTAYYAVPVDPKDNVWAPEKAKQDKEREEKQAAAAKRQAAADAKSGGVSKETKARREKIAKNKAARTETQAKLAAALAKLKATKSLDLGALALVVSKVLSNGGYSSKLVDAAKFLGVVLPPKTVTSSWYSTVSIEKLKKLSPSNMVRLTAAAIISARAEDAIRGASAVPDEISEILGKKGGK